MLLSVTKTSAQYDVSFSHFWDMEPYYNPAAAGKENKLNIAAAYAMSFTGFENNPKSMYIGADMPIYFFKKLHFLQIFCVDVKRRKFLILSLKHFNSHFFISIS